MAYQIPVCECGNELIYWIQKAYTEESKILKNGKIARRPYIVSSGNALNWDRLQCSNCEAEYHIEFDSKHRIVRGEKME